MSAGDGMYLLEVWNINDSLKSSLGQKTFFPLGELNFGLILDIKQNSQHIFCIHSAAPISSGQNYIYHTCAFILILVYK